MTTMIEELREVMSTGKEHDVVEFLEKIELEIEVYARHIIPVFENNQFSVDVNYDFDNNAIIHIPLIDVYNGECDLESILYNIGRSELGSSITAGKYETDLIELSDIVQLIDTYEEGAWR